MGFCDWQASEPGVALQLRSVSAGGSVSASAHQHQEAAALLRSCGRTPVLTFLVHFSQVLCSTPQVHRTALWELSLRTGRQDFLTLGSNLPPHHTEAQVDLRAHLTRVPSSFYPPHLSGYPKECQVNASEFLNVFDIFLQCFVSMRPYTHDFVVAVLCRCQAEQRFLFSTFQEMHLTQLSGLKYHAS